MHLSYHQDPSGAVKQKAAHPGAIQLQKATACQELVCYECKEHSTQTLIGDGHSDGDSLLVVEDRSKQPGLPTCNVNIHSLGIAVSQTAKQG